MIEVLLYEASAHRLGRHPSFRIGRGELSAGWVLATLLPEARRERLKERLAGFVLENRDVMATAILPAASAFSAEAYRILSDDLSNVLAEKPALREGIGDAIRRAYGEHLAPVVEEVVFPSAGHEAEAIGKKIFEEFYRRISFWSIGWKAMWNEEELERYVLEHLSESTKKQEAILRESGRKVAGKIWADPAFQKAVEKLGATVLADESVRRGLADVGKELVRRNRAALYAALQRQAGTPEWQEDLLEIVEELEPVLEDLVEEIALAPGQKAISEELARVIRRNVLQKDLDWLIALPSAEEGQPAPGARFQGGTE